MILAVGKSRKDKRWRNVDVNWDWLLNRLRDPHRTHETARDYRAMLKDEQSQLKDVGGFVGGRIEGGRRKAGAVTERWLLTLDADTAPQGMWEDVTVLYDYRAACYSTHSHTPDKPRLRWVLPLSRAVTPEEYVAIARKVADWFGIEAMDPTTYQPERLMYWPSCPSDGEYEFHEQDGPVLDPDEVLREYGIDDAWRDSSLWPIAKAEKEIVLRETKKAGEPTEKPGIVGIFCRVYDIHSAIATFLPDVYEECASGDRYTYLPGSTAAGAVVYNDGAFLFSNHATDPAGQQLCNAFDLVRVHKFGALDDGQENQDITRRPSYVEMCKWASQDPELIRADAAERMAQADEDFADMGNGESDPGEDDGAEIDPAAWTEQLERRPRTMELEQTLRNCELLMENLPELKGFVALNQFTSRKVLRRPVPWHPVIENLLDGDNWLESDTVELRMYLERRWKIMNENMITSTVKALQERYAFNPILEYLQGIEGTWDGVPRVDTMFIDWLGAEDNPYVRAVTRKWMAAAVARIYQPGRKFDNMPVIVGPQGSGKSTLALKLSRGRFTDSLTDLRGKEAYEQLRGAWIVELAELAATKRSEVETIKNFISKTEDVYRPAYEREVRSFPRQCVFYATTNDIEFLKDRTGNRRFWPIMVSGKNQGQLIGFDAIVDQLWAEAITIYKAGEVLWLDDPEIRAMSEEEQQRFTVQDELAGQIEEYLDTLLPENWDTYSPSDRRSFIAGNTVTDPKTNTLRRDRVSIAEIRVELCGEELTKGGGNDLLSRRIANIMNTLPGWKKENNPRRLGDYGRQKVYARIAE